MYGCVCLSFFIIIAGALFNQIVEKLNHLRAHHINPSGCKRLIEVFLITVLTGTVVIYLPMSGHCRILTREIMLEDGAGCFPEKDLFQVSYGTASYDFMEKLVGIADNSTTSSDASSGASSGASSASGRRLYNSLTKKDESASKRMLLSFDEKGEMEVLPPERRFHLRHLASGQSTGSGVDSVADEEGSEYYGSDVGPGESSDEMLSSLKKHLQNHRVVKSHRDYKEYDIVSFMKKHFLISCFLFCVF